MSEGMSSAGNRGPDNRSSEKSLEERTLEFSQNARKTLEDLISLSRDILSTEEGHALIRKTLEHAGKKFDDRLMPEPRSRTDEEHPEKTNGNSQGKIIHID